LTGREVGERLGGTIAANVLPLIAGADVLRVHDVREMREALITTEAILGRRAWRTAARG
jgi:dihydropteroate synthase